MRSASLLAILSFATTTPAQNCTPNNPPADDPPTIVTGANCIIGGAVTKGPAPTLTVWPTAPADIQGDPLQVGIPFYVEAWDQDKYVLSCTWGDSRKEKDILTNDRFSYSYTIDKGSLPEPGSFVGGTSQGVTWPRAAALYKLPRGLPDGQYNFKIRCTVSEIGNAPCHIADQSYPPIVWDLALQVTNCTSVLLFQYPQTPPLLPPGAVTLANGSCCDAAPTWSNGTAISPIPGNNILPAFAKTGDYVVLAAPHQDTDYLVRTCDDTALGGCGTPGTVNTDYLPADDACRYLWTAQGGVSSFIGPANERAVLWRPSVAGDYDICAIVTNPPGQAADAFKVSAPFQFRIIVLPALLQIESQPPFSAWAQISDCDPIQLYVNGDDDDRGGDLDGTQSGQVVGENDLHGLRFTHQTGQPNMQIRCRLEGLAATVKLYKNPDRTQPISTTPQWETFTTPFTIYVEGVTAHAVINSVQIVVEFKRQTDPDSNAAAVRLPATVFGVSKIAFVSDPQANGKAIVTRWDETLPALERPDAFTDANLAKISYYVDPGANPQIDTPQPFLAPGVLGPLWDKINRHRVQTEVTITPPHPGRVVYVSSLDVDDNSYKLYGTPSTPSIRDFLDPFDRTVSNAGARADNNDKVALSQGGDSKHGAVELPAIQPPQAARWLPLLTDSSGKVSFDFVSTLAPGDNFRVLASLGFDTLQVIAPAPPFVVARIPADYADPFSLPAERDAAVCFRRNAVTQSQLNSLVVPETTDGPVVGAETAKHTLASHLLTVRRHINVEVLKPEGSPPEGWNYSVDPGFEDISSPITRYVTRIEGAGAAGSPFPHREVIVGPTAGPETVAAADLNRKSRINTWNTYGMTRPFPGPFPFNTQDDQSPNYGGPRYLLQGRPAPTTIEGAFEGGALALGPQTAEFLSAIWRNGDHALYLNNNQLQVPFEVKQGAVWVTNPAWVFTLMKPFQPTGTEPPGTELVLFAPLTQPIVVGTTIRVGSGPDPAGYRETQVLLSTAQTIVVQDPDPANRFRFPVLIYTDTGYAFRGRPESPTPFATTATLTVGPFAGQGFNLVNYFLRDACIAVRVLAPPYSPPWSFRQHIRVDPSITFASWIAHRAGFLASSQLLNLWKLSQDRCWCAVCISCPDGQPGTDIGGIEGWVNNDPLNETFPNVEKNFVVIGQNFGPHTLVPALWPNAELPYFFLCEWPEYDVSGEVFLSGEYGGHSYGPSVTRAKLKFAKTAVHELLHSCLPLPMPVSGDGWELYGSAPEPGRVKPDLHHSIPGVTNYDSVPDAVVTGPTGLVQGSNGFEPTSAPSMVSPYAVRWIKQALRAPHNIRR